MKKILSVILCLVMLILCFVFVANATDNPYWFEDVPVGSWVYPYVGSGPIWEWDASFFETHYFYPDRVVTRGEMLVWFYEGAKGYKRAFPKYEYVDTSTQTGCPFSDVDINTPLGQAVTWAYKAGIIKGVTKDLFRPDDPVTREMACVIYHRYTVYLQIELTEKRDFNPSDLKNVSAWAKEGVKFCIEAGFVRGFPDGTTKPGQLLTRAQLAVMEYRHNFYVNGIIHGFSSPITKLSSHTGRNTRLQKNNVTGL